MKQDAYDRTQEYRAAWGIDPPGIRGGASDPFDPIEDGSALLSAMARRGDLDERGKELFEKLAAAELAMQPLYQEVDDYLNDTGWPPAEYGDEWWDAEDDWKRARW